MSIKPFIGRLIIFILAFALIAFVFSAVNPSYLSGTNIRALFRHMSVQGLTALGLTFVIVVRRNDLSFPGVASFGAMTMGWLIAVNCPLWLAVTGGIMAGMLFGLFNGLAITCFRLPDIVTTIATGGVAGGFSYFYSNGTSISQNFFMSGILDFNDAHILGMDAPFVILFIMAVLCFFLLHASKFGYCLYATGENPTVAFFSGISLNACILMAFALCGSLACMATTLLVASSGAANVTVGVQLLMPAYAAVYLGAALFGRPSILASLAGAALMSSMLNGFTLLAVPYYYSDAIVAVVLIMTIALFDPKILDFLRYPFDFARFMVRK